MRLKLVLFPRSRRRIVAGCPIAIILYVFYPQTDNRARIVRAAIFCCPRSDVARNHLRLSTHRPPRKLQAALTVIISLS